MSESFHHSIYLFIIESCTKHKQNIAQRTVLRKAPTNRTVHRKIEQSNKMTGIWSLIDTYVINYIGQFCFGESNAL